MIALSRLDDQDRERFYSKVDRSGGEDACWLWTAHCDPSGYGRFKVGGRCGAPEKAHRVAWELDVSPIPPGLDVLHDCDERYPPGDITYRRCVNTRHLRLGTQVDNVRDRDRKGRTATGTRNAQRRRALARRANQIPLPAMPEEPPPKPGAASDEWFTPPNVFEPLHAEFDFTLDVCATKESAKVRAFFSVRDNGLEQSWRDARCWMNPPYSDIGPWLAKAEHEIVANGCALVVALLPAWTDRTWWHMYVEPYRDGGRPRIDVPWIETRFIRARVRFGYPGNPTGRGNHGGGFDPSVLVIWRSRSHRAGEADSSRR